MKHALAIIALLLAAGCSRNENPDLAWARGVREQVQDKAILQQQRDYREVRDAAIALQLNAAEERKIPYADVLGHPPNWPEISELRERQRD